MRLLPLLALWALTTLSTTASPASPPNTPASITTSAPTTGPTPPSAPSSLLLEPTASLSPGEPLSLAELKPRVPNPDPEPQAATPTPSLPDYGPDSGLDAAITAGLANSDPEVRASASEYGQKYYQTTYYSCVVSGTYSHCGWHRPIVAYDSAADGRRVEGKAVTAGVLVGAFVGWLFVGW